MSTSLETLPGHELLTRTRDLVRRGNAVEADLLAHLGEVDARRLYLEQAFPSMFVFCLRVLHFSESVAYKRISAARAARRHPEILAAVRRGELHITAVSLLAPRLTQASCAELIRAARHKSADETRRLLADRDPKPDVVASMRRTPGSRTDPPAPVAAPAAPVDSGAATTGSSAQPTPSAQAHSDLHDGGAEDARTLPRSEAPRDRWKERSRSEPLGGERYCVRFTADAALHAQLQELQALMRHQIPDGDLGEILARAVPLLLEQVRKRKFGDCPDPKRPRPGSAPGSRSIPAATRRAVVQRDGEGCSYVSPDGQRCGSREFLEYHHRDPWARTRAHPAGGITLFCRAHNQLQARRDFGEEHMDRFRKRPAAQGSVRECIAPTADVSQLDSDPVRPVRGGFPSRPEPSGGASRSDGTL